MEEACLYYQESYLVLEAGAHLTFTDNHATGRGGAIFVEGVNHPVFPFCFFQYYNFSLNLRSYQYATVYFSGNVANVSGSALYGGNIEYCSFVLSSGLYNDSGHVFNSTFNYADQTGPS